MLLLTVRLAAEWCARHAERDEEPTHAIRAVMQQEGAIAHGDTILRTALAGATSQLGCVDHLARLEHALQELAARFLERARRERDDHPLGSEELAQLHRTGASRLTCEL